MLPEISQPSESPPVDVKIFDGPAIVNMVMPCTSKTFTEYALDEFLPYLQRQSGNAKRVDVVWDRYFKDSLKGNTHINRGVGVRRKVTPGGPGGVIPNNWSTFLCCSPNKVELFPFLSETIVKEANEPLLVATVNESVMCNKNISLQGLMPCSIEEADERMVLHAKHVSKHGTRVSIKTVDSDVLSVAAAAYKRMKGLTELWVEMGKGKHIKFLPVHEISSTLGPLKSIAVPFFHSISGCDDTSGVSGKGKKSFFEAWLLVPEVTTVFAKAEHIRDVNELTKTDFKILEKLFVALYCPSCNTDELNVARRVLFTQGGRSLENIPPTSAALKLHILRSALKAIMWHQWYKKDRVMPNITD